MPGVSALISLKMLLSFRRDFLCKPKKSLKGDVATLREEVRRLKKTVRQLVALFKVNPSANFTFDFSYLKRGGNRPFCPPPPPLGS